MADSTLKGHRLQGGVRPSKAIEGVRVCAQKECVTRLSRYNKREFCNQHAPISYPRVRGRFVDNE